ncbi:MAG: lipopolysaccharide assembly protein LapA domain-containing protein [Chloroflexota bacterium]
MFFSLILTIVVTIVAVLFASFNHNVVHVNLFGYGVDGEVGLFMIIAVIVGVLVGVLLMLPSVWKRSWAITRQQRLITELEQKPVQRTGKKKQDA